MGGIYSDYGYSITTDVGGNVYTIGHFIDIVDFDPGTGTAHLTSSGSKDVFIQKLDGSGNFIWVKQMGGFSDDYGKSITTDAGGNIYTIGYFKSTVDFDPGTGIANLTAVGIQDVFIQKLSQCIPTTGTDVITACDTYTWINGITYTASNSIATYILNNAGGCDSVVTLSLTINNSSSVADTVIACNSYFWQIDSNTYTASGIYNDTLINVVGCDSVVTLNLTINTADIRVYVYDPTITAFASGASYQWLDCNNSFAIITGETAQNFTATVNGDYAVEVIQNSCVDTSVCITISTLGINKAKILEQISIFPNPTTGKIFIEGDNIETIEIINAIGKILEQYAINDKTILIDMSSHNKGVYFIRVTTNNGVVVSKLILE